MKKLKIVLMAIVVTIAVGGAFANKRFAFCEINYQYYKLGFNYYPAGTIGLTYVCIAAGGICTYWRPDPLYQPNYYAPCRMGNYYIIPW